MQHGTKRSLFNHDFFGSSHNKFCNWNSQKLDDILFYFGMAWLLCLLPNFSHQLSYYSSFGLYSILSDWKEIWFKIKPKIVDYKFTDRCIPGILFISQHWNSFNRIRSLLGTGNWKYYFSTISLYIFYCFLSFGYSIL